jgi:hypothetical protein
MDQGKCKNPVQREAKFPLKVWPIMQFLVEASNGRRGEYLMGE